MTRETTPAARPRPAVSLSGAVGALAGFLLALTPSLLPRPALFLGLVAGVGAALGYGLFATTASGLHRLGLPPLASRLRPVAAAAIAVLALVVVLVGLPLSVGWQNEIRASMGLPAQDPGLAIAGLVAAACFVGLLALGGVAVRATRWTARHLGVLLPRWAAVVAAIVAVAAAGYVLTAGLVVPAVAGVADRIYAGRNTGSADWVAPTQSPLRSGGPGSAVAWDTLGWEGRAFIAEGPSQQDIAAFTGTAAAEPIRLYVGLDSAETPEQRAALAVQELRRTAAFDRDILVVAGVAGTGWLENSSVAGVEYVHGGNTAIVASQYSFLPSWISVLVDQERARQEGQALFDAVWREWSSMQPAARPRLIVYGLSLGSFSIQSAFATEADLAGRTDGAILAGTPSFSEPWRSITTRRDPGSPQRLPVVGDGQTVRFADDAADLRSFGPWASSRIAFLQHANDPVVWWSFDLIAQRPDWLAEPPGPAVSPRMRWLPLITFLQVTVDQFFGVNQPNGYGHNYSLHMAQTWVDVTGAPEGWTAADTQRLQARLTG